MTTTTTMPGKCLPEIGNISVAIAEDYSMIRRGIANMLDNFDHLHLTFSEENGQKLLDAFEASGELPDVILMDVMMPVMDGFETARRILSAHPEVRILFMTGQLSSDFLEDSGLMIGHGYLTKDTDMDELARAIEQVHCRGFYFNEETEEHTIRRFLQSGYMRPEFLPVDHWNAVELAFIRCWCSERSDHKAAKRLGMSVLDVQLFKTQIMKKLGICNETGFVVFALSEGYML